MIERIERISRVNGIAPQGYGQRQGYADSNGSKAFDEEFKNAMKEKKSEVKEVKVDDAYALNVTRATQSLFYQNGLPAEWAEKYDEIR